MPLCYCTCPLREYLDQNIFLVVIGKSFGPMYMLFNGAPWRAFVIIAIIIASVHDYFLKYRG